MSVIYNTSGSSVVFRPGSNNLYSNLTSDTSTPTSSVTPKVNPQGQTVLSSSGVNMGVAGSGGTGASSKGGFFSDIDWDKVKEGAVSTGFNILGNLAYNTSGRRTTKGGEALHTSSQLLSMIPVVGPAAGALANIVGGFINSNWGSYVNDAAVDSMKQKIHNYSADLGAYSTNDQLLQDFSTTGGLNFIDNGDIDSEGSKATKITHDLNSQIDQANRGKVAHMFAAANALDSDYDRNMRANYSAFGGPITGAIDYANMMDYNSLKRRQTENRLKFANGGNLMANGATWDNGFTYVGTGGSHEANPYEGVQMGVDPQGVPNLVEEGEVVWNNDYVFSKRLKVPKAFRDKYKLKGEGPLSFADTAKKFAEENKERPNDPISKRGRDSLLAALKDQQEEVRMKKQQREAKSQFNALSPDEQLGIMQMAQQYGATGGPEEQMNEEYSMTPDEAAPMMAAFGGNLFRKGGYKTKAEIEKNMPWLKKLYAPDDTNTEAWDALFNTSGNIIAAKGSNTGLYDPNGAYMKALGVFTKENWNKLSDSQKQQVVTSLKSLNTTKYKNYTVDNVGTGAWSWDNLKNLATDGVIGGHHGLAQYASQMSPSQAEAAARKAGTRFYLRDTDNNGNPVATKLTDIPDKYEGYSNITGQTWDETLASKGYKIVGNPQQATEGDTDYTDYFLSKIIPTAEKEDPKKEDTKITMPLSLQQTASRYTAPIANGVLAFTDALGITNKEDYSNAEAIENAAQRVGTPSMIRARMIGDTAEYNPFSTQYYANKIAPQTRATAEGLLESAAGNPMQAAAGLLTLDRNAADQMGDLFRKAEEYNLEQKMNVKDFNRATAMFHAQQALTADKANQAERRQAAAAYATGIAQAEAIKQKERQYAASARSTNFTNAVQDLTSIGDENEQRNWLKTLYASGYFGNSPTMERALYRDKDVLANFMQNNPGASTEDVTAATGISSRKVNRYFKKKGLTV